VKTRRRSYEIAIPRSRIALRYAWVEELIEIVLAGLPPIYHIFLQTKLFLNPGVFTLRAEG